MKQSFLVIGTGEVGISMLQALYNYQEANKKNLAIAALVLPSVTEILDEEGNVVMEQTVLEKIDLVRNSIEELAAVFSKYDTIICCSGFSIGKGMQVKITKAVLEAGVARYVPWQFGADYDKIGRGSAQPVFDEQLDVRDLLRGQSTTKWLIVSAGMITSFIFREDFGVISLENKTVNALKSWDHSLTLTSCEDIGKLTVEVLFHEPAIENQVVFVSGETATFEQIVSHLDRLFGKSFKRVLWDENHLEAALKNESDNIFHKYRMVFTNSGVTWPMEQTFNHQQNIPTVGIVEWAKTHLEIV